jgi:hypothetical protein
VYIISMIVFPKMCEEQHTWPLHHNSRYSSGLSLPSISASSLVGAASILSATYPRILRARSMRFALRRLLLSFELAFAACSKGMKKGRYPSDEMLGSRFWKGSRMKDTLTISFPGRAFC